MIDILQYPALIFTLMSWTICMPQTGSMNYVNALSVDYFKQYYAEPYHSFVIMFESAELILET